MYDLLNGVQWENGPALPKTMLYWSSAVHGKHIFIFGHFGSESTKIYYINVETNIIFDMPSATGYRYFCNELL